MKGWPDYVRTTGLVENYDEYGQNYPIGIGDGAARLGSIKTYDMRGRVWWMDDFEAATLHWLTENVGIGGAQTLISDYVRNGEQALGLTANTGAGRTSRAYKLLQIPRHARIGFEVSFSQEADFGAIQIINTVDNGIQRSQPSIIIDEATGQLQYQNDAGGWPDSGVDTGLYDQLLHFHTVKIVFNTDTNEWTRILYDDQEIDLTGEPLRILGTTGNRFMFVQLYNTGDGVNNARVCWDDFIITIMEPE